MAKGIESLFAQPRISDIKADRELVVASQNLIDSILNLTPTQYGLIQATLLPTLRGFNGDRQLFSAKFLKRGTDVKVGRYDSLKSALEQKQSPISQRKDAFSALDQMHDTRIAAYTLKPVFTTDRRTRRIQLSTIIEGSLLYWAVANGYVPRMNVDMYADAHRAEIEGMHAIVSGVPSRDAIVSGRFTDKKLMYDIKLSNVPAHDTQHKYVIGNGLLSDHTCALKRYGGMRFTQAHENEQSGIVTFCPHDVAAYVAVAARAAKDDNLIPARFSPFALPSEQLISFYRKLETQVLIQTIHDEKAGTKNRPLTNGEKEILLWGMVRVKGYDATFVLKKPLAEYSLL